jgi:hypothetical protein
MADKKVTLGEILGGAKNTADKTGLSNLVVYDGTKAKTIA